MADENSLNANLAEILRKALRKDLGESVDVDTEIPFTYNKGKRRVADIVCYEVQGYKIGIEAKRGWGIKLNPNKKASIAQAEELVDTKNYRNFCDAAIALIYPDGYENQDHLQSGKVKVAIRTPILIGKKKTPEWKEYAVKDLPDFIARIPSQLGKPEELSKRAEIAINEAFKKFSKDQIESIMDNLRKEDPNELADITNFKGLLVDLLTCFMFHSRLDDIRRQYFRKKANYPPTLPECIASDNSVVSFCDAYEKWLKVDYTDILEWNGAILKALPTRPRSNDAVKRLAQTAYSIQMAKGSQHHDLVGITFCNAIESAKQEGAMYTTLPAATLLTHLMFHKTGVNWKNLEEIKALRIVDFACGSGTLLIAAANYILQHEKTGNREEVSRALFEKMLYGFDINQRAIFQTTTGLGMIAPSVQFKKTQLRGMPLGIHPERKEEVRLGSLEMLLGKDDLFFHPPLGQGIDRKTEPVKCDKFHFAIMNPPFTIEYKRFKQKDPETEKKLREREKEIRKHARGLSINSNAGSIHGFFALVDKYIDPKIGKAGIVAPAALASNPAAQKTRIWLPKHFHIPYIIVSYDSERGFFSGFTSITEMLLVLDRKKKTRAATQVIKLANNPVHETDAYKCAIDILSGQEERWEEWGEVDAIQPADMERGDWSATQFLSNDLYRIAKDIPNYWTSTLGKQVKIKQMGRGVRGCAQIEDGRRGMYSTPALWYHKTDYCDKLEVKPDCHVKPKKKTKDAIAKFEKVCINLTQLKIAEQVRLTTVRTFACRTPKPSLNNAGCGAEVADIANVDKETVEKAVCLILNSTPAKLEMILRRKNKTFSYISFAKENLNRVAMPLLSGMSVSAFRELAKVYDEWCKQPRKRLPEAHTCLVQLAIDKAVCQHTGFPEDICKKARHLLAQEPMVTGQRYQANPKETNPQLF